MGPAKVDKYTYIPVVMRRRCQGCKKKFDVEVAYWQVVELNRKYTIEEIPPTVDEILSDKSKSDRRLIEASLCPLCFRKIMVRLGR